MCASCQRSVGALARSCHAPNVRLGGGIARLRPRARQQRLTLGHGDLAARDRAAWCRCSSSCRDPAETPRPSGCRLVVGRTASRSVRRSGLIYPARRWAGGARTRLGSIGALALPALVAIAFDAWPHEAILAGEGLSKSSKGC